MQKNDVLTPEELRAMVGKRVWDETLATWCVVQGNGLRYTNGPVLPFPSSEAGFYRRPPSASISRPITI